MFERLSILFHLLFWNACSQKLVRTELRTTIKKKRPEPISYSNNKNSTIFVNIYWTLRYVSATVLALCIGLLLCCCNTWGRCQDHLHFRQGKWGTARSTNLPPSPRQQVVGQDYRQALSSHAVQMLWFHYCMHVTTEPGTGRCLGRGVTQVILYLLALHPLPSRTVLFSLGVNWRREYKLSKMGRVRLQGTNPAWSSFARCGHRLAQHQVTEGQPSQAQANHLSCPPPEAESP